MAARVRFYAREGTTQHHFITLVYVLLGGSPLPPPPQHSRSPPLPSLTRPTDPDGWDPGFCPQLKFGSTPLGLGPLGTAQSWVGGMILPSSSLCPRKRLGLSVQPFRSVWTPVPICSLCCPCCHDARMWIERQFGRTTAALGQALSEPSHLSM